MKDNFILFFFASLFLFFTTVLHFSISLVPPYQDIDSKAYIHNAKKMYDNGIFFSISHSKKDDPYYALGYAFFLATVYKLFGVNNNYVVWIQVFLALLTAFFIFRATKFLFNKTVALISFIFFSFNVGFLVFSQFILTEILLAFLLVFFVERFAYFLKKNSISSLIQSGLTLGISISVKPAAIYFIFPLVLLLLFFYEPKPWRRFIVGNGLIYKLKLIFFLTISFYIPVIGYMFFNKINYGNFSVAPLANENLYLYLFPKVLAYKNGTDWVLEKRNVGSLLTGSKLNEKSWSKIKKKFCEHFKRDPIIFFKIWLKNVFKTCVGLFTTNLKVLVEKDVKGGDISFFKTKGNIFQRIFDYVAGGTNSLMVKTVGFFEAIWSIFRYILCLIALCFLLVNRSLMSVEALAESDGEGLFLKKKWAIFFFFVFYLFYFSMIAGHDGCARFRMMFEPVLIILAAFGFWLIMNTIYLKRGKDIE